MWSFQRPVFSPSKSEAQPQTEPELPNHSCRSQLGHSTALSQGSLILVKYTYLVGLLCRLNMNTDDVLGTQQSVSKWEPESILPRLFNKHEISFVLDF